MGDNISLEQVIDEEIQKMNIKYCISEKLGPFIKRIENLESEIGFLKESIDDLRNQIHSFEFPCDK